MAQNKFNSPAFFATMDCDSDVEYLSKFKKAAIPMSHGARPASCKRGRVAVADPPPEISCRKRKRESDAIAAPTCMSQNRSVKQHTLLPRPARLKGWPPQLEGLPTITVGEHFNGPYNTKKTRHN